MGLHPLVWIWVSAIGCSVSPLPELGGGPGVGARGPSLDLGIPPDLASVADGQFVLPLDAAGPDFGGPDLIFGRPAQVEVFSSLALLRPQVRSLEVASGSAELSAARGEWENFQLRVHAGAEPITIDVATAKLRGPSGAFLDEPQLYRVGLLDLQCASNLEGGVGKWPDPLIPVIDRFVGERRSGLPSRLGRGEELTLWVELFVPRSASPGDYRSELDVRGNGKTVARVGIALHVHPFVLPATSSLPVTFGFAQSTAAMGHFGRVAWGPEDTALTRLYALSALRHRISLHGGSMAPAPWVGRGRVDFRAYDQEVGPFLDGTADPGGPAEGARWSAFELRRPRGLTATEQAQYLTVVVRHLRARGWIGRVFDYTADEPQPPRFAELRRRAAQLRASAPEIPRLVTHTLDASLLGAVDIWCPPINLLDDKPGQPANPSRAAYDRPNTRIWWYQSCLSHGCQGPGETYFSGWPSYAIDAPPIAHRALQWLTYRYRIGGELYYNTVESYRTPNGRGPGDPWRDAWRHGGNGDGTLFYPGRPNLIGGRTHIPVESIRLKRIRDGLEDYEYLRLLERRFGRAAAERWARRLAPRTFELRPQELAAVRREIAQRLDPHWRP